MKKILLILLCVILCVNLFSQEKDFCMSEFRGKFPKYFEQERDINYILESDSCTEFMFYNGGGFEKLQAIGYIENYKGFDLFFVNTEYLEDINDQESDGFSVENIQMYIFKEYRK